MRSNGDPGNGQAAPASVYALDQVPGRANTEEMPHL